MDRTSEPGTELKMGECHQPWAQNRKLILSGINILSDYFICCKNVEGRLLSITLWAMVVVEAFCHRVVLIKFTELLALPKFIPLSKPAINPLAALMSL